MGTDPNMTGTGPQITDIDLKRLTNTGNEQRAEANRELQTGEGRSPIGKGEITSGQREIPNRQRGSPMGKEK